MKNIILFIIFIVCFVLNNSLRYLNAEYINTVTNVTLKACLELLFQNKFEISVGLATILSLQGFIGFVLLPKRKINLVKEKIISRINQELFSGDLRQHRITLYREVGYIRAWAHHLYTAIYHLLFYRKKSKLYFHWLPYSRYLIIDARAALECQKSTTYFRVEENREKECQGIVGLIRYQKSEVLLNNLPDISDIDVENIDIKNKHRKETPLVREYMTQGHIRWHDIDHFKKIHRHSKHFLGTIIRNAKGKIWGVLLADSNAVTSPFDKNTKTRFNSFATTLSDLL